MSETERKAMIDEANAATVYEAYAGVGAFVNVPDGYTVYSLEHLQERPNRIKASPEFRDTKSLADYLKRFDTTHAVAFSSPETSVIEVIVDYHSNDVPSHCCHDPSFTASFTPEYEAWRNIHRNDLTQKHAGEFLEERKFDVQTPDPASLMEMVMQFEALKKVSFKQSTRLHDGQRQFQYIEENETRGNVTLPEVIFLEVAIYDGEAAQIVPVRVKYRINDGDLIFTFEIADMKKLERAAFNKCEESFLAQAPKGLLITHV